MQKRDTEFLFEMGTLRFIGRVWQQFITPNFANLAEHTLRVIWIAIVIAEHEKNRNLEKIIKMALVHDISESRAGDVHYISRQYAIRDEKRAIKDILKETSLEKEFFQLWQEYEEHKSPEAKIVKDADNIDVDLELREQAERGNKFASKLTSIRKKGIRPKLFTKGARELWDSLYASDPDGWHLRGPNRFVSGDLKIKK